MQITRRKKLFKILDEYGQLLIIFIGVDSTFSSILHILLELEMGLVRWLASLRQTLEKAAAVCG